MRPINRAKPMMPSRAYKTYEISSPLPTHFRAATCAEASCIAYMNGWQTTVDESLDLGQRQAHYIRKESGRRFVEHRNDVGLTVFGFEAGQRCFASDAHRVPLGRPELFVVRDGDWRGNPRGTDPVRHTRAEHWVEDFALHQQAIADERNKG